MNHLPIVGALLSALFFCSCGAEETESPRVEKSSTKTAPSTEVELNINMSNGSGSPLLFSKVDELGTEASTQVDVLKLNDGRVSKSYSIEPGIYAIGFERESILLAIDGGQSISIDVDAGDVNGSARVTGSPDTKTLKAYERYRKKTLDQLVNPVRRKVQRLREEGASNEQIEQAGEEELVKYEEYQEALMDFVKDSVGTSIALYATALRWSGDHHIPFLEERVAQFRSKHGDIDIARQMEDKLRRMKQVAIGATPPDIDLPNTEGENRSLMDNLGDKYTLIDFWASWCPPCRRESAKLKALYDKFSAHGFQIYAVSLDDRKEKWTQAIDHDNRDWINVNSFEVYETPAAQEYSVSAVPQNFLLDSSGTIIAKDLSGDELFERISQLME